MSATIHSMRDPWKMKERNERTIQLVQALVAAHCFDNIHHIEVTTVDGAEAVWLSWLDGTEQVIKVQSILPENRRFA